MTWATFDVWGDDEANGPEEVHVIPTYEEHDVSADCWCGPREDDGVFVHRDKLDRDPPGIEGPVTTDAGDAANGPSVPDQTRRIVVYDARCGRGGLDVPVGCTVGEAALLAAEMFGVRVGPNDRPSFGLRGTGLHASDPLPDDEDYELFVIGGTV